MKKVFWVFMLIGIVLGICTNALAQGVTTATISGVVIDNSKQGLPGANVVALHVPSGTQYGAVTRPDGRFTLPGVRVGGPYKITISFIGYKTKTIENVNLSLGQVFDVDATLIEESAQLEEVVITAQSNPVLNNERTGAATNVSREQLERMPTINRNFADMTRMTPQMGGTNSFAGRSSNFNNITIDGALFNNAFGLSGVVGGQTSAQPISLDAIEQVQVSIAPFDVRQGSFTGAGVNAVTRSGTNEFSGSIFTYRRNDALLGENIRDTKVTNQKLEVQQTGFRLGGPIIKNKLFFFINGEIERRTSPGSNYIATRPGVSGSNVSSASAADLDALSNFLKTKYNYNTGAYEGYDRRNYSDKFTAKIDWNISANHKLNVKYNYLKSFADINPSTSGALAGGGNPSVTHLPYQSAWYIINNNLNSIIAELNSNFGNSMSNNITVGYTAFRDFRESNGGVFPLVNIGNGAGQSFTTFGYEPFSANNLLNTDVFQFSDNLTLYEGKHTITIGTYNEFYKFKNGFAPFFYGGYQYASLADFYNSTPEGTETPIGISTGLGRPTRYEVRYSAVPGVNFPYAEMKAMQIGFYAQDEWQMKDNLKFIIGVRGDIPIIDANIIPNNAVKSLTFQNGLKNVDVSRTQEARVLWSPRIGFNWDVTNDKKTQVRGGTGIFTGRVPYVWISNQISNTGNLFGSFVATGANAAKYPFNPDVNAYKPTNATANSSYNLAFTSPDFKFPQVWRTNIAVDRQLPWDMIGTFEFMYTKDLNAVYHQNVNLPDLNDATKVTKVSSIDQRPRYLSNRINSNISDAILMDNTSKGYSYTITAQLQKYFGKDFYASIAYNYTDARSVNDGGSIAQSIWRDRPVSGDPNANVLSYSNFLVPHRIVGSINWKKEYYKFFGTSISLFMEAQNNGRFSYTYAGDLNGDGSGGGGNDLIYIPKSASEINLQDIVFTYREGNQNIEYARYTAAQQWADLEAYINQDDYLKSRKGQYAERNGAQNPMYFKMDLSIKQDFYIDVKGKRNTIQLSFDIFNFTNFLNKDWGIEQISARSALISFGGYDAQGNPRYTFPYAKNPTRASDGTVTQGQALSKSYVDNVNSLGSRWQGQFGIRYIFN
ncbi:MAG: carboxypeptidase regulatory-like domain-containing protein [Flammeovirgaceae bacterium]